MSGLAAITAAAVAGILFAPAWLIAAIAAAGFFLFSRLLARAERASLARSDNLRVAIDQLEQAAGPSGAQTAPASESAAARIQTAARRAADSIAALQARNVRLVELFMTMDEPIVAVDDRGSISLCNPAAQRLIGVPASRILGRPIEEAFTISDLVRIHAQARAGRPIREQVRMPSPKGPRMLEVAASPIIPDQPAADAPAPPRYAVILAIRDVTDLSQSLKVKTDFVANASHELRTPIASLRIAVDTLSGLPDDEAAMRERLLGLMTGSIARLEDLIRDLLDLSMLESPEAGMRPEPVAASDLAAAIRTDLERVCRERRLSLSFEFAPELQHMRSDHNLLLLILGNLTDNAAKFAFEGTTIRIVGAVWREPNQQARNPDGTAPGPGVRFEVIDQGVGIPLEHQQRVFERFYQIDPARAGNGPRRGTGLGLAIVKHAARRLGGTVQVDSVWQRGTTMTVELPNCLDPSPSKPPPD